jgi:hypothetical protein
MPRHINEALGESTAAVAVAGRSTGVGPSLVAGPGTPNAHRFPVAAPGATARPPAICLEVSAAQTTTAVERPALVSYASDQPTPPAADADGTLEADPRDHATPCVRTDVRHAASGHGAGSGP